MPKILIVEDEKTMAQILATKFTQEGFEVSRAGDGQDGLDQALADKPDAILLDLLMPKMTGAEMLSRLRKTNDWGAKVPVIVLTNFDQDEKTAWGVASLKPAKYLLKVDMTIDEIVSNVRAVI